MPGDRLLSGLELPAFEHFIVFEDLLPTDVLCRNRESRALGTEARGAELRQGHGVLIPCALSSVLMPRRGLGFKHVHSGKR